MLKIRGMSIAGKFLTSVNELGQGQTFKVGALRGFIAQRPMHRRVRTILHVR